MNTTKNPPPGDQGLAFQTHALQMILSGPFYVRTQYCLGSLQNRVLTVVMTCHDDHRIRGQLMGMTKSTTDKLNKIDETILWDEPNQVPMSPTRVAGSFNAANNALNVYKTSCTYRWEHIKAPLLSKRRYQEMH